jgi:hypothetical protein
MHRFLIPLLAATGLNAEPAYRLQPRPAKLLSPAITEASGLAGSPTDGDFLWIVNDSGGSNEIHLAGTDGKPRGTVSVDGAKNRDWEDLAAFTLEGKSYLLIADTGDNESKRDSVTLYIVREPDLPAEGKIISGKIPLEWKIDFTFTDGPRDCEAVAVDAREGKIILLSKRTDPPGVYELPLRPGQHPVARKIGETETKATGFTVPVAFRNQPTGMDISADGKMAVVATYHGAFLFPRKPGEEWTDALARKPETLGPHGLAQAEAVAFAKDGKRIFAVSEKPNSPIASYSPVE